MMTIKQQGGIFGRNPTFNDVEVEGSLTVNGEAISDFGTMAQQDADSVNIDGGAIDGTTIGLTTPSTGDFTTITGEAVKSGYIADFRNTRNNQDAGGLYIQTRYNNSVNSILKLATNSGSATALEVRGDLDMDVYGSIIMKNAGEGIDFSATSGTGTSELFDDYEEGTWTPVYTTGSGAFGTITYDVQLASYVKVGNVCVATFRMRTDSVDPGTATNLLIGGLPFTSGSAPAGSGMVDFATTFGGDTPSAIGANPSATTASIYYRSSANGATLAGDAADLGTGANANFFQGTIVYITG